MKFRDIRKLLENSGFAYIRRADGSHTIFRNSAGKTVIVPEHHNKEYPPHLISKLRKAIDSSKVAC